MTRWLQSLWVWLLALGASGSEIHVGAGQPHGKLRDAIDAASPGDTLIVHPGVYQEGALVVDKSITLSGQGWPVIDGAAKHQIITIAASGVVLRGFEIRNSGVSSLEDIAGVTVSGASHVRVEANRLKSCTFGVYLSKSRHCTVRGNQLVGTGAGEHGAGNGIHIWSCDHIAVSGNEIRSHRDGIYLEFARESSIERNKVVDCQRYGLHYMFSHDSVFRRNRFERNGAGAAVMYTRNVEMSDNRFADNWGSAAYGLMLKDMSGGTISGNVFDRNSIAVALHGSNRMKVTGNTFRGNGWALQIQGSSSDNTYEANNFTGNSFDVAAEGELDNNRFANNYWEKYDGYDLDRDGRGDVPFRPVGLYAVVVGRIPPAVLLLRSPVVHLLDQAEKAFPSVTPERVLDESPAMRMHQLKRVMK